MSTRINLIATVITNAAGVNALQLQTTLPPAILGVPYSGRIQGLGGAGGYVYAKSGGPGWLTLDTATGIVGGTPTGSPGNIAQSFTVTDQASTVRGPKQYRINVYSPVAPVGVNAINAVTRTDQIQQPQKGYPYSFDLAGLLVNPTLPVTAVLNSGSYPAGITLSGSVLSAATVTGFGSAQLAFTLTDSGGNVATVAFVMAVKTPISITQNIPAALVGVPYKAQFTASGGDGGPYSYAADASGGLSIGSGLVIDPRTGVVTGIPTAAGLIDCTNVNATDLSGANGNTSGHPSINVGSSVPSFSSGKFAVGDPLGSGVLIPVDYFAQIFGDGFDGGFALDGTNTYPSVLQKTGNNYMLLRDIYCTNMIISGSAKLLTNGYCLYGNGRLTLDGCAAATIAPTTANYCDGVNAVSGASGGGGSGYNPENTIAGCADAGRGGSGVTTGPSPLPGSGIKAYYPANGGGPFWTVVTEGYGGAGSAQAGGLCLNLPQAAGYNPVRSAFKPLTRGLDFIHGGAPGRGGGSGGNDGANFGGSGGGGGGGGGVVAIYFYEIKTDGATAARCIGAPGYKGGNGYCSSVNANIGGGGGGSGGGGGYVHIVYAVKTGASVANLVCVDGGAGGNGAANTLNAARNGRGSSGGKGGGITIINVVDSTVVTSASSPSPPLQSGTPGTAGAQLAVAL